VTPSPSDGLGVFADSDWGGGGRGEVTSRRGGGEENDDGGGAGGGGLLRAAAGCVEVRVCGLLWRRRRPPSPGYRRHSVGGGAVRAPPRLQVDGGWHWWGGCGDGAVDGVARSPNALPIAR
jgi:hypothetical protein